MIGSLNLQGYIKASTGRWLGLTVYIPGLAIFAAPGQIFDPLQTDSLVLPLVPVVLHAISIQVLNAAFRHVAHRLTDFENHRTEAAYKASVLVKRFLFEASDCYLALFYIAFELQDVPKLRAELIALFTADTVRRVLLETLVPLILNWRAVRQASKAEARNATVTHTPADGSRSCGGGGGGGGGGPSESGSAAAAAAADAKDVGTMADSEVAAMTSTLELEEYEDFDDYLEMVLQFGYVTLFASALPLAPAICTVCNSIELAADAVKLAFLSRRPRPVRTSSIGGWAFCCYGLTLISIYSNLFIIGVASDQLATIFPSYFMVSPAAKAPHPLLRIGGSRAAAPPTSSGEYEMKAGAGRYIILLLVAMEHALLLLLLLCETILTRPPQWVRLTQARREHEERAPSRRFGH